MRPMDSAHSLRRFLIRLADRAGLVPGLGGFELYRNIISTAFSSRQPFSPFVLFHLFTPRRIHQADT